MTIAAATTQTLRPSGRAAWPPGVVFDANPAPRAEAAQPDGGVPAFVGFATVATVDGALRDRRGPVGTAAVVLDRWDARLWEHLLVPAAGSMLRASVRGFFANGGRRCVVLAQPLPGTPDGAGDALVRLFEPGSALSDRSDVDLVCVPDAALAGTRGSAAVQRAALDHCEALGDRFALLDVPPPPDAHAADELESWVRLAADLRSGFGALYGPWLVADPTRDTAAEVVRLPVEWRHAAAAAAADAASARSLVPPCGHVAGLIARLDRRAGPQHAPANEALDAVLDAARPLSTAERARLDDAGINALHALPGRGLRVGGARTLRPDAVQAHVSTVRVVVAFRRWLALRMRDLVFEPQTPRLRQVVRDRLVARCLELQRAGALAGLRPEDGFDVRCDDETNPAGACERGGIVAHVALAITVPAEFIVLRVVQDASGFTLNDIS